MAIKLCLLSYFVFVYEFLVISRVAFVVSLEIASGVDARGVYWKNLTKCRLKGFRLFFSMHTNLDI